MRDGVILLVEDNPKDQELIMRALAKSSIPNRVVIAHDGVEALDYLLGKGVHDGRDPELPAFVILDLKLPKVDGIEVLRRIRADARTKLLPAIILTSSKQDEDRLAGYNSGANSYVQKPVEFTQFSNAVSQLGIYWLGVNEPPPG
jgi:two-component system response regulator